MDSTTENDYFELEPFDQYKPQESKFQASLKWLFSKAYLNTLPNHLNEPFFEENELGKSLRNDILIELISGKVYCTACKNIFANHGYLNAKSFLDISNVFEQLARNSIQVTDENDDPVTPQVISQDSPFYVSAHLALIDSLMVAYSMKAMRLDNVINSIKKYTKFNPSTELPNSLETTCVLWLNKIMKTILNCVEYECELYIKQSGLVGCQSHLFLPEISNDISLTLSSGTILAILLIFYTCDADIDLSDIALQENVGFEESVENLNLVKEFCDKYLNSRPFCFNFEDFLYSPYSMKINKLAFIAELFYWFEVQPITNLVRPNHFDLFKDYIKRYTKKHFHATTSFISSRIGDVTRNSFIKGSYTPVIQSSTNNVIKNQNQEPTDQLPVVSSSGSLISNKLINASNNSFNSLLDNVALDASQIYDEPSTSSSIKNNDDEENNNETQVHPMFTSRTYIKSSSNTRLNLNQPNENKSLETNSQSPRLSLTSTQPQQQQQVYAPPAMMTTTTSASLNKVNYPIREFNKSDDLTITKAQQEIGIINQQSMKTTDISINGTSAPTIPQSQANGALPLSSNGLVRRLSVTARPGDIFYKVKDVTDSSTTDTLNYESNDVNDYAEIDNFNDEEKEIIIKPLVSNNNNADDTRSLLDEENENNTTHNNELSSPTLSTATTTTIVGNESSNSFQLNGGKKITSWNVKRHQTTSLGINQPNENVKVNSPKDDTALNTKTNLSNNTEPGSPQFTKELLSIRMQLKEKKSSMERDKRKLESELEKQRQKIGKQVFLQVVQKKPQNESSTQQQQNGLTVMTATSNSPQTVMEQQLLADRSQLLLSNMNTSSPKSLSSANTLLKETPRRQWDKTQKGFIDLENDSPTNNTNNNNNNRKSLILTNSNGGAGASSTSSMSTPSSSASQSPPLSNGRLNFNSNNIINENDSSSSSLSSSSTKSVNNNNNEQKSVDLSKAYYSRDEMVKTIEALKISANAITSSKLNINSPSTIAATAQFSSAPSSSVKDLEGELEKANSKLTELKSEITRLTLMQQAQNPQSQKYSNSNNTSSNNSSRSMNVGMVHASNGFNLNDEKRNEMNFDEQKPIESKNTESDSENQPDGAFFISFGNGTAKREKPPALTPKKNLIFIKTNEDNIENVNGIKKNKPVNNNLLMTATNNNGVNGTKPLNRKLDNCDDCSSSSDSDSAELKQRKKEMIMAKQLERRQQQELIRQKREEERARKAEEIRMKEEEAANKKMLEKTRKETIFQAYIEKKKQLETECQSGYHFGPPSNNLLNAKKFHSTYRLKSSNSTNNFTNQQKQNQFDQFDQASVISDRSSNLQYGNHQQQPNIPQPMIKTYSTNNLYQGNSSNNNNNINNNANKRQSRLVRPPSCARPTISSLRKMNRTFSLNNVSDIGGNNNNNTNGMNGTGGAAVVNNEPTSNKNLVVPLTQATINAFNTNSARFNYTNNSSRNLLNDNAEESMSQLNYSLKLQSKYASSNYLNDYNSMQKQQQQQQQLKQSQQQYPHRTRTTPRRRTPRNAEEFLVAAGVTDTQSFLTKGYYVGSMLNLNEFGNSSSTTRSTQPQQQNLTNHDNNLQDFNGLNNMIHQNGVAVASSSSSSSASGFNHNNKSLNNNKNDFNTFKEQNIDLMKRRNSIHDTTSISMANLNFLNNNFSPTSNNNVNTSTNKAPTPSYFRNGANNGNGNSYAKARSHTTAIIGLNDNIEENYTTNNNNTAGSTSNGSSALASDSSSSPTPNGVNHQIKQQSKLTLGPLMSAVSKLENVSLNSPATNSKNNQNDQRFIYANNGADTLLTFQQQHLNEDDYDDYEYLERNLGAEPANNNNHNNNNLIKINNTTTNTTTNTNVTDYYTDESNSCNNEDFNQFNCLNKLNNKNNNHAENVPYLNEQSPLSINNSNNICATVASPYHQMNNNYQNNSQSNNNYYYTNNNNNNIPHQLNIHQMQLANNNQTNNGWDHASMISNNTIFSGPKLFKRLTGKSNKLTIINSLNQRVLAGTVNAAVRKQVIDEIEASEARHFIILFRDYHLQYRGVYSYTTETDYIEKVVGQGPQKISEDMVETYFKYNSGGRQFSSVPTKHFSVQCDGVTIHSVFWGARKQSTPQTNVAQIGNGQSPSNNNFGTLRR